MPCRLVKGDITQFKGDAIVNAANTSLLGGGGVDGAIHRVGGPEILAACRVIRNRQGGCQVGQAVITTGGRLAATYVIHTVGPVWRGGGHQEKEQLESCYIQVLRLAREHGIKTLAFPNISTGIYGYPKKEAAEIAIKTVKKHMASDMTIDFYCFNQDNYDLYDQLINGRN